MAIDVNEFLKTHAPKHKKSPLWEYESQIRQLTAKGASIPTIRVYLSANGLDLSENWIRKFIKRLTASEKVTTHAPPQTKKQRPIPSPLQTTKATSETAGIDELLQLEANWKKRT